MVSHIQKFLSGKLTDAGVQRKPYLKLKKLKQSNAVHLGAILLEDIKPEVDGSKTTYYAEDGTKIRRIKRFKQTHKFNVVIGEKDNLSCSVIYEKFLEIIGKGFDDGNGNWIEINIIKTEWFEEDDNILKSNVACQTLIECIGGIYEDVPYKSISSIEITL